MQQRDPNREQTFEWAMDQYRQVNLQRKHKFLEKQAKKEKDLLDGVAANPDEEMSESIVDSDDPTYSGGDDSDDTQTIHT